MGLYVSLSECCCLASLANSAGSNVKALQHMLGHASAAMALDRYADLSRTTSMQWLQPSIKPGPNRPSSNAAVTEYLRQGIWVRE